MPRCENEYCGRTEIPPDEVKKCLADGRVYCLECMDRFDRLRFSITYDTEDGLTAKLSKGDVSVTLRTSNDELRKIVG